MNRLLIAIPDAFIYPSRWDMPSEVVMLEPFTDAVSDPALLESVRSGPDISSEVKIHPFRSAASNPALLECVPPQKDLVSDPLATWDQAGYRWVPIPPNLGVMEASRVNEPLVSDPSATHFLAGYRHVPVKPHSFDVTEATHIQAPSAAKAADSLGPGLVTTEAEVVQSMKDGGFDPKSINRPDIVAVAHLLKSNIETPEWVRQMRRDLH